MPTWRKRDDEIQRLAARHVCQTRQFLRYFTSPQAAYRRVEKLRRRGLLRLVGQIIIAYSGCPENVYCNGWKPKDDQLRHNCC